MKINVKAHLALCLLALLTYTARAQWQELYTNSYPQLEANAPINSLYTPDGETIYAAGLFTDGTHQLVSMYDYPKWKHISVTANQPLQANDAINALTSANGVVYAGGQFTDSAGQHFVGAYAGSGWSKAGGTNFNGTISALCTDAFGNMYAAGGFTNSFGENYVARFDGVTWAEVSNGSNRIKANSGILAVAADATGNLYAAGYFTNDSGQRYVAKWNGLQWAELGSLNCNGYIYRLATDAAGNVYAAGSFTNASGKRYVAKWNGTQWSELGGTNALQANAEIFTLTTGGNGHVYAAGEFTNAAGKNYVAVFDGNTWAELGTDSNALNANAPIQCVVTGANGTVYCVGNFTNGTGNPYVAVYTPVATAIREATTESVIPAAYPNPTSGELFISHGFSRTAQVYARIFDVHGRLLNTEKLQHTTGASNICRRLSSGYYILQIEDATTHTLRSLPIVKQ